jgi:uncharacterized protein (PEP-CTERM system associated)
MVTMAATANRLRLSSVKPKLHRQTPLAGALSIWMAVMFASPAFALDWRLTPTLGASATLSDNVNQSATDQQGSLILSVTPGFTLQSEGSRRVQAAMNYGLTGVTRTGANQNNDLFSALTANGKAELMEDFLFIDGTAVVSQQLISLLGSPADATINSSNRAATGSYDISPYIKKRFGTFADAEARYSLTGGLFQNNAANNSYSNSLSASLASGTQFNNLFWGLDYYLRHATVQNGQDAQFEHYGSTLGYDLTRHVRVFGTLGYDSNDYTATPGTSTSGRYWTLGMGWAPNRRANIEASFGDSYFGRTYSFNFNYRTSYSVWTASYNDGVTDISQQLLSTQPLFLWSCNGELAIGVGTLPPAGLTGCVAQGTAPIGSVTSIGLANGIYVSKTLRGTGAWSKGKSSLGFSVFDTRRQYQQLAGLPEDETRGIAATYVYRMQPRTTLNAGLEYGNVQSPAGLESVIARDDNLYTANLGVSHQFGSKLSGALALRHQERNSNASNADFTENDITASVIMSF